MQRRKFVQLISAGSAFVAISPYSLAHSQTAARDLIQNYVRLTKANVLYPVGDHFDEKVSHLCGEQKGMTWESPAVFYRRNDTAFTFCQWKDSAGLAVDIWGIFFVREQSGKYVFSVVLNQYQLQGLVAFAGPDSGLADDEAADWILPAGPGSFHADKVFDFMCKKGYVSSVTRLEAGHQVISIEGQDFAGRQVGQYVLQNENSGTSLIT